MGNVPSTIRNILRREDSGVETVVLSPNSVYKWPPKIGNYFANHFIMGGQKFDTPQPEAYLFGDNSDLNFLGSRPLPFPYTMPQQGEPTRTLQSLINIRKDTLRLVKHEVSGTLPRDTAGGPEVSIFTEPQHESDITAESVTERLVSTPQLYNIEFTFDCDMPCIITILYFAKEEIGNGVVTYHPRDDKMMSEGYAYKGGANQTFSQPGHCVQPSNFDDSDWLYNSDKDEIPIVIHCAVDNNEAMLHAHMTFAAIERTADGYAIKAIKQKQLVDGLAYMLQEFYGIENKDSRDQPKADEELEDNTSECVICMSDVRDTLILPCRHLCLCNGCADSLRYQASSCPICRSPFHALLQIRAIRRTAPKNAAGMPAEAEGAATSSGEQEESGISQKDVPHGYEAISLIEALNGSHKSHKASPPAVAAAPGKAVQKGASSSQGSVGRNDSARRQKVKQDSSPGRRSRGKPVAPARLGPSIDEDNAATAQDIAMKGAPAQVDIEANAISCTCFSSKADKDAVQALHTCTLHKDAKTRQLGVDHGGSHTRGGAAVSVRSSCDSGGLCSSSVSCDSNGLSDGIGSYRSAIVDEALVARPGRMHDDDDADSGIPDDLTEESRNTADEVSLSDFKKVKSAADLPVLTTDAAQVPVVVVTATAHQQAAENKEMHEGQQRTQTMSAEVSEPKSEIKQANQ